MSSGRTPMTTSFPTASAVLPLTGALKKPASARTWPLLAWILPGKKFIEGDPMKPATKTLVGRWWRFSGVSSCCNRPSFITAMRSPIVMASTWSCVT